MKNWHSDGAGVAGAGWRALAGVAGLLALAGCTMSSLLPEAQADPTRFFVLSTATPAGTAERMDHAPVVRMRPIDVAGYLQTRPMIVRRGENELEFREYARWGEPIEQGITRVLREALLARGAKEVVVMSGRTSAADADYELSVRVLAAEGLADGGVNFRAAWELTPLGDGQRGEPGGNFQAGGLSWSGRDEAMLAAALSQAVNALAGEIVGAMTK